MNDLERFKAVVRFETPDYVPIFAFPGAPGMSRGCMRKTHDRLVATGMPSHVGGVYELGRSAHDVAGWKRYWGTTDPLGCGVRVGRGARGFESKTRVEGGFEIIESESGAVTRQVVDNAVTYSMPEYVTFPVRDRASWDLYKERMTPTERTPDDELTERCREFEERDRPLAVPAGGVYGFMRGLLGPERLSLTFYDDPELLHDMAAWRLEQTRRNSFPIIERLRPEIVQMGEDLCYNHGMLCSPDQFHEFCGPYYREVGDLARACDADMVAVDTDGNAMEFVDVIRPYGVTAIFPFEVKAGNDLFELRKRHPDFILMGWLEKECANEGNEDLIGPEILSKVPPLLDQGGYFPNGDHGIQPWATFENLCKFMTLLHEVTGNPEGEFPRTTL